MIKLKSLLIENNIPQELLNLADKDENISGYVYPNNHSILRIPIFNNEKQIVGFFTPREEDGIWRAGAIFVLPQYRGHGFSTKALFNFFKDKKGKAFIDVNNTSSQKAFSKAGFIKGKFEDKGDYSGNWFEKL